MGKITETVLEIDLNALAHNYAYLRSKIDSTTRMMGVVKAFAYGSDSVVIAKKLEALGIDFLAVAYTNEGVVLREGGITKPILVLHPQSTNFETIIKHQLTPSIYSEFVLKHFIEAAQQQQTTAYPIHLKLNTGLNRLGFHPSEIETIHSYLANQTAVNVEGLFSHLAASEDPAEEDFTRYQLQTFTDFSTRLMEGLGYKVYRHLCNTSGIINYPEAHFDMVRTGIGLYGFGNHPDEDAKLQPIANLKTIISQIHTLQPGDTVGYNRVFKADRITRTATLPLGHADGINRIYGKQKTNVLINGQMAPIIGNVCMDMLMIDVTGIDCNEGDEVLLFGKDKSAETFANNAGTISYELITSISQRVKRHIKN